MKPEFMRIGGSSCHDHAARAITSLREVIRDLTPCHRSDLQRLIADDYGDVDEATIGRVVGDMLRDRTLEERDGVLEEREP